MAAGHRGDTARVRAVRPRRRPVRHRSSLVLAGGGPPSHGGVLGGGGGLPGSQPLGLPAQPGLALLRLAEGNTKAAESAIGRVAAETTDRLTRAKLLPAFVEIMLTVGDIPACRDAASELTEIAGSAALKLQSGRKIPGKSAPPAGRRIQRRRSRSRLRCVQGRLPPAEVEALLPTTKLAAGLGELAKLFGIHCPRSLPTSHGPKDLRPDRFLSRARAVCITEAFSALGIWVLSGPRDLAMEQVV